MHVDVDETKTPEKQLPLNLKFETTPIEQVSKHRQLGVTVDEQLKWQTHINNICRTISRRIFLFFFFETEPNCQPKIKISLLLCTHYVTYELCFKCVGWMCLRAREHKQAVKFLMPIPNIDYKQKSSAPRLLPLDTYYSLRHHRPYRNGKLCLTFELGYNYIIRINSNEKLIERVRRSKRFVIQLNKSMERINTHTKINSIMIQYYKYLVIQSNVKTDSH